jgi:hypothetical protein
MYPDKQWTGREDRQSLKETRTKKSKKVEFRGWNLNIYNNRFRQDVG